MARCTAAGPTRLTVHCNKIDQRIAKAHLIETQADESALELGVEHLLIPRDRGVNVRYAQNNVIESEYLHRGFSRGA